MRPTSRPDGPSCRLDRTPRASCMRHPQPYPERLTGPTFGLVIFFRCFPLSSFLHLYFRTCQFLTLSLRVGPTAIPHPLCRGAGRAGARAPTMTTPKRPTVHSPGGSCPDDKMDRPGVRLRLIASPNARGHSARHPTPESRISTQSPTRPDPTGPDHRPNTQQIDSYKVSCRIFVTMGPLSPTVHHPCTSPSVDPH